MTRSSKSPWVPSRGIETDRRPRARLRAPISTPARPDHGTALGGTFLRREPSSLNLLRGTFAACEAVANRCASRHLVDQLLLIPAEVLAFVIHRKAACSRKNHQADFPADRLFRMGLENM